MTAASMARENPARHSREWTGPSLPKPAWIAIMVLGFIVFWPIGLAILGFLLFTGRLGSCADSCDWVSMKSRMRRGPSTGNAAFDEYREETLRRLEAFLEPRIAEAERGEIVEESVEQIFASVRGHDR